MFNNSKRFMGIFLVVLLFSMLTVSTVNAEENENTYVEEQNQSVVSSESNIVLNDYMKVGYSLEASDFNITSEREVFDINGTNFAKYYGIESLSGQEYFAIISNSQEDSTVLLGGEGNGDVFELGDENYYYFGGFSIVSADDTNQIIEYIKSEDEDLSTYEIKQDLSFPLMNTLASTGDGYGSALLSSPIFSQYDPDVKSGYQNSACGPTTMAVILQYWHDKKLKSKLQVWNSGYTTKGAFINSMYANRGGTFYGMSVNGVRSGLENEAIARGYSATTSSFNNFYSYKTEIDNNRPLAVKFDQWFSKWKPGAKYDYDYHWTPGLGYIYSSSSTMLRVQSLEAGSTSVTDISYAKNSNIITMVSLSIN
ncbi:C39 family peptidase [Lysinibacillus xylanilyticus]|uniref:C39 family peptidase n=1 Tax=Lysinibacillus xylanilyticus TaxID=582475 RepID=UPI002B24EB28|nr:C39 family peptidase [Lysinibacillus xylanilyticus]MEB2301576.1 C39 family peptidase [Lysinibacillus xylanilyticus]